VIKEGILKFKNCLLITLIVINFANSEVFAANRLIYENFDDQKISSPVYLGQGNSYTWVTGRNGSGSAIFFRLSDNRDSGICWQPGKWPTDEVYISNWMRYPDFTRDSGGAIENMKILYLHITAPSTPNYSATDIYAPTYLHTSVNINGKSAIKDYGTVNVTDGKWHHYEWYFNIANGTVRLWIDGNKELDKSCGPGWPTGSIYRICSPSIDAGEESTFSRQIDDWEVWDGMPSGSQTTSTTTSNSSTTPPPPGKPYVVD